MTNLPLRFFKETDSGEAIMEPWKAELGSMKVYVTVSLLQQ